MLKALVITPNSKTGDLGCLLAIARAEACRREHVGVNPPIRALRFFPELCVYVAVYEAMESHSQNAEQDRHLENCQDQKRDGSHG